MIDSFLLTVIFVWAGFLILLFLVYFPYRTVWYDKKHGMKHTFTDTGITTEWDFQSPLTLLKMLSSFIQCEDDKEHYIPYTRIDEIQSLGTEDWSEYEEPDISEILNLPW